MATPKTKNPGINHQDIVKVVISEVRLDVDTHLLTVDNYVEVIPGVIKELEGVLNRLEEQRTEVKTIIRGLSKTLKVRGTAC